MYIYKQNIKPTKLLNSALLYLPTSIFLFFFFKVWVLELEKGKGPNTMDNCPM